MKHPDIPSFAYRLFLWFCREELFEELEGDLEERFLMNKAKYGLKKARWIYSKEVFKMIRPSVFRALASGTKFHSVGLLRNNIRVSFRNLIKQKEYSLINIIGLSTSLAISMLIILFLIDQDRMDEHNSKADRTYRVVTEYDDPSRERVRTLATTPYDLQQLVSLNIEEVEASSMLIKSGGTLKLDDRLLDFNGLYVSPNFLSFFEYDLTKGNPRNALDNANGMVISEELATKLFNKEDPIGKIINVNDLGSFSVTGVVSTEVKSHMEFDLLLPSQAYTDNMENQAIMKDWLKGSRTFYNYYRLNQETSPARINDYLSALELQFPEEEKSRYGFSIQRLDQINLSVPIGNEVGITTPGFVLYFFCVLALVLILSSSFNYMNLAVARGLKRAKEVGVRKIIGAGKRQIFIQFLIEAQMIVFTSFVLGFGLLQLLVPAFNNMKVLRDINGAITMNFNQDLSVYLILLGFTFFIGLVAGLYPATYLSSFRPLKVLKGINNAGKRPSFRFRKVLVFFQYSFSIVFIITTIILFQQAKNFASFDYGFNHKNVLNVPISNIPYETFRNELLQHSEIEEVSAISSLPVLAQFPQLPLKKKVEGTEDIDIKVASISIDSHGIDNLELSLMAGRDFSSSTKDMNEAIINEKTMKAMGFDKPENVLDEAFELIYKEDEIERKESYRVVGVLQDFTYEFSFKESGPLVMVNDPQKYAFINIRIGNTSIDRAEEVIESVWTEFDDVHPFEYESYSYMISDIDEEFIDLVNIVGLVAFFAILIASLGQFSMVVHHIQLRLKEVGIRKVLGSSTSNLQILLSKDFVIIIVIAIVTSTPLAWKINAFWTEKIYQSVSVSWLNVSIGISSILLLSLGMVYYLVRRAALANPVDSISYE